MSIELPDGKICRSLPEQVAENAKNIKEIKELLDGLNIQDNLVVIADISQILTRSELDIVERPVAFLYYSDQLYIKRNEAGGSAFFDVIFSITGSTVLSFNSKEIEVYLSTGALSLTTSTVSTYSKSELDNQLLLKADITYVDTELAKKANLTGATFTGNIDAPEVGVSSKIKNLSKIVDSNGNYRFIEGDGVASAIPGITFSYCKWSLSGTHLMIVLAGQASNGSELIVNSQLAYFTIPSWIGDKIFPVWATYSIEAKTIDMKDNSWTTQTFNCVFQKSSQTILKLINISNVTLTADRGFRIQFDLLIDTN